MTASIIDSSVIYSSLCELGLCRTRDRTCSTLIVVSDNFRKRFQVTALITRMSMHTPPSSPVRFRMTQGLSKRNRSDTELARMMRAAVAADPLLLSRAHRYLPTYSTARRTGGCKWYIHYYPQSNGWNLLGDKLLRPPTLLAEFRDSIRAEAERDTF
ncbi:hypothetical protein ALC57_08586 [Trachymyrmex cornetzi]|uniref:Uncharacterized protein n=1 Tax=Trachymyrmex cornetzi TaxID=471704 RepID=A0A151J6U1_9HYME|nr:hypothetical protein ALC57_08586 [Trachymyrmex cornetzi]